MSRLEAGKAEPHREQVDLAEVLEAARAGASDPGSIRLALDPDLPLVEADAAQLERAFAQPGRERRPLRRWPPGLGGVAVGRRQYRRPRG